MRVAVFGAAGGVGARVIPLLVDAGHVVIGVVRRPDAVEAVSSAGADAVLADVTDGEFVDLLAGVDAVIWAIGARFGSDGPDGPQRIDHDGALRVVAAGASAGVARWVQVSSLMADRPEIGPPMLAPFLHAKGTVDEALRQTPMAWTVLRPSGLSDVPGTATVTVAEHLGPAAWGGGMPPQVSRDDVAALAVACVVDGLGVRRSLDVVGGTTPIVEALTAL
jgi:uncharacterized protein YbjT (DUF2867 family)